MIPTFYNLVGSVVRTVVFVASLTGLFLAIMAPRFLGAHAGADQMVKRGVAVGAVSLVLIGLATWLRMRAHRVTVRTLLLGTRTLVPSDLLELAQTPAQVTRDSLVIAILSSLLMLLPGVRGKGVDLDAALSLTLLADMFFFTSALALHVWLRRRVAMVIALAPRQAVEDLFEWTRSQPGPKRELIGRIVAAVAVPIALVGLGTALLAYAHVRTFETRGRLATASAVAVAVLEPLPGPVPYAAQKEAIGEADRAGFRIRVGPGPARFAVRHASNGITVLRIGRGNLHATVWFAASTIAALAADSMVAALVAIAFALLVAVVLATALSEDLEQVTRAIESLGMDRVLDGRDSPLWKPRFGMVQKFSRAVESVSARFRLFAETHEEAILAREHARHLRGLLFASVSHDLKSALNSILGFAEVVDDENLNADQRQSLQEVRRSGRELLALVENILDAARVEAGQIVMVAQAVELERLLHQAVRQSDSIVRPDVARVKLVAFESPIEVWVDPQRVADAMTTLITLARKTCKEGEVRVEYRPAPGADAAIIAIFAPCKILQARLVRQLMLPEGVHPLPRTAGGLALGLSLARSIFLLSGGALTAMDTPEGLVYRITLPVVVADAKNQDARSGDVAPMTAGPIR